MAVQGCGHLSEGKGRVSFSSEKSLQSPSPPKPRSLFPCPVDCGYLGAGCGCPSGRRVTTNHRLAPATGRKGPAGDGR